MQRANRGAVGLVDCAPKSVSLGQRQLSQGCLAAVTKLSQPQLSYGLKIFLFSLVCSLLLLLVAACAGRVPGLVVAVLYNQLILNLIQVHLDILATHLRHPPVLKVEVLVLSILPAPPVESLRVRQPTYLGGTLALHLLEPGLEALVKEPGLLLQLHRGQVLLVALLLVVEREEQGLQVEAREVGRLRIKRHCWVRLLQPHAHWLLRVDHLLIPGLRLVFERLIQHFKCLLLLRGRLRFRCRGSLKDAGFFLVLAGHLQRRESLQGGLVCGEAQVRRSDLRRKGKACGFVYALEGKGVAREEWRGGRRVFFTRGGLSTQQARGAHF